MSDNTGASTLSFPIPMPPATGGFGPALALSYSSQGGDGAFGFGWSLRIGEVRRSTRFGIPTFTASDSFELNGQPLVLNSADSTATRTRYHTATETFARILHIQESGQDSWEVTQPDGTILRFGIDAASRVLANGVTGGIQRWLLREMENADGNVILFDHRIESGADYPDRVRFSYRGVPRTAVGTLREVQFLYQDPRPDPGQTFEGGTSRAISKRASEIVVKVGTTVYRRMTLSYADQVAGGIAYRTGRSRLASIQIFGKGGTAALPPQKFEYSDAALDLGTGSNWQSAAFALPTGIELIGPNGEDRGVRFAEINGDGRIDMVRAFEDSAGSINQRVYLNTATGWVQDTNWSNAIKLNTTALGTAGRKLRYVMQPGAPGTLVLSSASATTAQHHQVVFASARYPRFVTVSSNPVTIDYEPAATWMLQDVSGDGLADLIGGYRIEQASTSCGNLLTPFQVREVWINVGNTFQRSTALSAQLPPLRTIALACSAPASAPTQAVVRSPEAKVGDLNDDDRLDVLLPGTDASFPNATKAFLQTATGWSETPGQALAFSASSVLVDINRDGLADVLVGSASGGSTVFLNVGTGWCSSAQATACGAFAARYLLPAAFDALPDLSAVELRDLNGDGLLDVLKKDPALPAAQGLRAWIQDPKAPGGSVWVEDTRFAPPDATGTLVDLDADGDPDFIDLGPGTDYASRSRFSDLLKRFENGSGGAVGYAYESAAKQRVPSFDGSCDSLMAFDGRVLWTTQPVVSARSFSGVDVTQSTQTFLYAQPRFLTNSGLSQGFALVQVRQPAWTDPFYGPREVYRDTCFAQLQGISGKVTYSSFGSIYFSQGIEVTIDSDDTRFQYEVLAGNDPNVGPGSTAAAKVGRLTQRETSTFHNTQFSGGFITETLQYTPVTGDPPAGYGFVTKRTVARATGTTVTKNRHAPPDTTRWIVQLADQVLVTSGSTELSKTAFQYSLTGRPQQITVYEGPRGSLAAATARTTVRSYDPFGNLLSQTDPAGHRTEVCYDGDSSFASGTACGSLTTEATHSVATGVLDPLNQITKLLPDPVSGAVTETLRVYSGDREKQVYDPFDRPVQAKFQPSGQSDILLEQTNYFDIATSPIGQPYIERLAQTRIGSNEMVRTASYVDGFGRPARTVFEAPLVSGAKRYFGVAIGHDASQQITTTTLPAACGSGGADPHCANLFAGSQPRTVETRDSKGRLLSRSTPDGLSLFDYRMISRSHPDFTNPNNDPYEFVLEMDPRGNLVQRIFDGDRVIWVDECTNKASLPRTSLSGVSCSSPNTSFYRYEPLGQIAEVYDATTTSYTDTSKAVLRSVFDSLGRVSQRFDIDKNAAELTTYDAAGNLATTTNARSQQVTYGYDALDRVSQVSFPSVTGTRAYTLTYDARTRDVQRIDQNQTAPASSALSVQLFGYDALGRRNRESVAIGTRAAVVTEFDLDLLGRPTQVRTPDVNTVLAQEYEGGYLRRVCELGSAANCTATGAKAFLSNVDYDTIGREIGLAGPVPSGATAAQLNVSYSAATYRLSRLNFVPTAGTGAERLDLTYGYDAAGNVTSIADGSINSGANDVGFAVSYTYDVRNRLLTRVRGSDTKHFTYDKIGNLTGRYVTSAGATNQTYDATRRHRVTSANGLAYTYDADGNVAARGTQQFRYDALQRLECIGTASATCSQPYLYGLDGIRIASDGGTTPPRVFAGDLFEWEPATGAATVRVYALDRQIAYKRIPVATLRAGSAVWGAPLERLLPRLLLTLGVLGLAALLAALVRAGVLEGLRTHPVGGSCAAALALLLAAPPSAWPLTLPTNQGVYYRWIWEDVLGSGVHVTDDRGVAIAQRAFEPWGDLFKQFSAETTERTFGGHRYEDLENLHYVNARWYDQSSGRFLSVDPVAIPTSPQSLNAYSYVENNPTSRIDPTGLQASDPDPVSFCPPGQEACFQFDNSRLGTDPVSRGVLGFGEASGLIPLFARDVYRGPFRNQPISIDQAFSAQRSSEGAFYTTLTDGFASAVFIPNFDQATVDETLRQQGLAVLGVGSVALLGLGGLAAATTLSGPSLVTIGAGLPPAVQSAVPKLTDLAARLQTTTSELLRNVLENGARYVDLANKGNINVFLRRPDAATGFIRVTLDPTAQRVISSGLNQARDVASGLARGRFVPLE